MTSAGPLSGLGVVLTRPRTQCEALASELEAKGARVLIFPAMDIVRVELSPASRATLESLPSASLALFVSANAAEHGVAAALKSGPWPASVAVAGVGEATAARLRSAGFGRVITPATGFDSESLLACPELQDVKDRRVIVFRGVGGREHLRTTLEARGAQVGYVECYRRERPESDPAALIAALGRGQIDAVHAMSAETVDNFLVLAGSGASWSGVALVVPHPAIARHGASASFGRTVVSGLGIASLVEALHNLRKAS
ncbi:MAG: uroporphyrinogen-III synthase [Betaproteobacteria bacterium]|nr:uroporphyrinogen-III synthase [Betaproteobacteria bacterium]